MAGMSNLKLNILLFSLLCAGIGSGLSFKRQQRSNVLGEDFNHPFIQTMLMFIGEALCYFWFMFYTRKYKAQYESDKTNALEKGLDVNPSQVKFFIAALVDFTASAIGFFAMGLMPLAIYYMLKGGTIIITAFFSVLFLKRTLYRQHYLGLFLTISGFVIIGVTAITAQQGSSESDNLVLGIVLLIISFFFAAGHLCLEEKFFHGTFLNAFEGIGYEGVWGILITWISLNIFSYIPCPDFIACPNGMMEDVPLFFRQTFTFEGADQPTLFIMMPVCIFFVLLVNGLGLTVTQYASALSRSLLGAVSPFIVWMITIGFEWDKWDNGRFGGYIVITLGCLIYNEIIVLPIFGLNVNTKKNLAKRKQQIGDIEKIADTPNNNVMTELQRADSENQNLAA